MRAESISETLGKRFRIVQPPTLVARRGHRAQIGFSRLTSSVAVRGRSMAVPQEETFAFHVPLSAHFFSNLWVGGRHQSPPSSTLGHIFLVDLSENPVVGLDTQFDSLRFHAPQAALDELAAEQGARCIRGFRASTHGQRDPVMFGLAQTIAAAMDSPRAANALFVDYIALAFFAHVSQSYGGAMVGGHIKRGGLAPWQLRRALEYIDANLDGDPSIGLLAAECRLSSSHFARAFKTTTGVPPHRWLINRRIDRASKLLISETLTISEVAQLCGFVDQSHLARVFARRRGCSPANWRRQKLA
jgi:AraC family transcriptional regulator